MFAYCLNSPVNMIDTNGCDPTPVWAKNIINGTATEADYTEALSVDANAWAGFARNTVDHAIALANEHNNNNIAAYSSHAKKGTTNPSNKNKHQQGQARKQEDNGGEKGDAKRKPNPNKRRPQNFDAGERTLSAFIVAGGVVAVVYLVANDVSGVGVGDDGAIAPLLPIIWDNAAKVIQ